MGAHLGEHRLAGAGGPVEQDALPGRQQPLEQLRVLDRHDHLPRGGGVGGGGGGGGEGRGSTDSLEISDRL